MVRALALLFVLLATGPALGDPLSDILADPEPLICRPAASPAAGCLPVQLAAASCGQTCYDDQNVCRQGCDRVYRGGGTDHEKARPPAARPIAAAVPAATANNAP